MEVLGVGTILLAIVCLADLPFARRYNQTLHGFFLMNGKLRLRGFVASILSANLSLGNFLIFISVWGFTFGWGGIFWFLVNLALNVLIYLLFMPAFQSYIEAEDNSGTIHEYLATTFGSSHGQAYANHIRAVASATTITGLLFAIVFELHLATVILAPLLSIDRLVLFALLTALICIYSGAGGFHTLIATDIIQSFVMIVGTIAVIPILWILSRDNPDVSLNTLYPLSIDTLKIGWPSIIGICVIGSGWFLVAMDQWQRTCATRNARRTRAGMLWYVVSISGFAVVYGLLGMFDRSMILPSLPPELVAQHSDGVNPLLDFFWASEVSSVPAFMLALVAIALLAAAMSTANTFLIVSGHSLVSDLLIGVVGGTSMSKLSDEQDKAFLGVARAAITGLGVFVIAAWLLLDAMELLWDPISFFFIAYSIQFALLAPMAAARLRHWLRPSPKAVLLSIGLAAMTAVVAGLGFWMLAQGEGGPILGVAPSDWLAMTPVITLVVGTVVLIPGVRRKP